MKTKVTTQGSNPEAKKINVWLVRSPEVSKQKFNDVFNLLGSIKEASGLAFQFNSKESEVVDVEMDKQAEPKRILKPWDAFFQQAEDFRASFQGEKKDKDKVNPEDYVVVLSDHGNEDLWFSGADYGGKNNIFVHCEDWDFFAKGSDVRYPIAYHVVITLLHHKWGKSKEEIMEKVHGLEMGNPHLGCINDFCEDKSEVHLKIRTGDICEKCIEEFLHAGVDKLIIIQVLQIIGNISRFMRFSAKWKLDLDIPVLSIEGQKREFRFRNYGNLKIQSTAGIQGRILYELIFMKQKSGQEIEFGDFFSKEFITQFKENYIKTSGLNAVHDPTFASKKEKMEQSIDKIILTKYDGGIGSLIKKINTDFEVALGEDMARNYQISRIEKKNPKDGKISKYYQIGNSDARDFTTYIEIKS
jgi:hypothetical protein